MKILKWVFFGLLTILFLGYLYIRIFVHQDGPKVVNSDGDALANKMLMAINKPAWDTLKYIKWDFRGGHQYVWDRSSNTARISWDDHEVHLRLDEVDGKVFQNSALVSGEKKEKAIQTAWSYWCNDSFWMGAPYKIFDPGTSRQLATDDDGKEGLLITYESGGVTPGDRYLWYLDDAGRPTGYRMWVSIIPVGGMYASWEDWQDVDGALIAQKHILTPGGLNVSITNVAGGQSWDDLGFDRSPIKL